jgi:predicted Fe-Mo cluster-binding NifX family protein
VKIAAITDDGRTISQHFGRAASYAVLSVEENRIVKRELRDKMGHRQFVHEDARLDEQGRHGFGPGSRERHAAMASAIGDCSVLLCRGMGWGAYESMKQMGIETVVTDIADIEEALAAYLEGTIVNRMDRLH